MGQIGESQFLYVAGHFCQTTDCGLVECDREMWGGNGATEKLQRGAKMYPVSDIPWCPASLCLGAYSAKSRLFSPDVSEVGAWCVYLASGGGETEAAGSGSGAPGMGRLRLAYLFTYVAPHSFGQSQRRAAGFPSGGEVWRSGAEDRFRTLKLARRVEWVGT